jgi:hypothetical protein
VRHRKVIVHTSAIVVWGCFRAGIPPKSEQISFINALRDKRARADRLCVADLEAEDQYKNADERRCDPKSSEHGLPFVKKTCPEKTRNGIPFVES